MIKYYEKLSGVLLLLVFLFFLTLCFHSRLATDDYFFIWDVRHRGITGDVISQYFEWCGRYAANFTINIFYFAFGLHQQGYFIVPLLSMLLLFSGAYKLAEQILARFHLPVSRSLLSLIAGAFSAMLFFMTAGIGETWFWYCSATTYPWSIAAFTWGLFFLTKKTRTGMMAGILCMIYTGGASEVYSLLYSLAFIIYFFLSVRRSGARNFFRNRFNRRLIIASVFFGLSFIIFLIAPGNYLRDALFPDRSLIQALVITGKAITKFSLIFLPARLIYVLAFAPVIMQAGTRLSGGFRSYYPSFKAVFILSAFLYGILLISFLFFVSWIMMETGPPRVWFMVTCLTVGWISLLSFYAGFSSYIGKPKQRILNYSSLLLSTMIVGYNFPVQYQITAKYAAAVDSRAITLEQLNIPANSGKIIYLSPLPPAGMLYSAEITADTNHFTNKELRLGNELKFYPAVK